MNAEHPAAGPNEVRPSADLAAADAYEICVRGRLDPRWSAWFDGFALTVRPDGTTVLRGAVPDQAALHGLLQRLRDLGLPLLSLCRTAADEPPERHLPPSHPVPTEPPGALS